MKKIKITIILILLTLSLNSIFSQSSYNVSSRTLSFLHANRTHYPSGTNGTAAGNIDFVAASNLTHDIKCLDATLDIFGHAPNAHVVGGVTP